MAVTRRIGGLFLVLGLAFTAGCYDEANPVAPPSDSEGAVPETGAFSPAPTGSGLYTARARFIDPARLDLVSTPGEREVGLFRFDVLSESRAALERDDVIVVRVDGALQPRVVLSAERVGDELILDTGPALWSDAVNTGHYGIRAPIGPGVAENQAGLTLPAVHVDGGMDIPPLGTAFEADLCALTDEALALFPAGSPSSLCGEERSFSATYFATVKLAGTIDSLSLLDGEIEVTGSMSLEMMIDGGGVEGGSPPVFAPCNRAAYLGCVATPTGANLISWLRYYAPSIPEASLPAVRLCVPGILIRVRAGYWVYPGWPNLPYWVRPKYERCRISTPGVLPTIVLPSMQRVAAVIQPRVRGGVTLYVKGDGKLGLRIPIPYIAYAAGYKVVDGLEAKVSIGLFVAADLEVKNMAAAVRGEFDEEMIVTMGWTPTAGWSSDEESVRSEQSVELVQVDNPDSVVFKFSLPIGAEVSLMASVADSASEASDTASGGGWLSELELGAEAKLEYAPFNEVTWSREQVHPDDAEVDNWHLSTDIAYELIPEAGIKLPDMLFDPPVDLEWKERFEFGRMSLLDQWGRGTLVIRTTTWGTDPDPDGYTVLVSRPDDLPGIFDEGAELLPVLEGPLASTSREIDATGTTALSSPGPCTVSYSDGALALAGGNGALLIVRAAGATIPNYAVPVNCGLLLIGRHRVELTGVAENCTVAGGAVRDDVWLYQRRFGFEPRSDTTVVPFSVTCDPAGSAGSLAVLANVPGAPQLELLLDGVRHALLPAGERTLVSGLAAGPRTIGLAGVPSYCVSDPVDVEVLAGETVDVDLPVICAVPDAAFGSLAVTVATSGVEPPADFLLKLDSEGRELISAARPAVLTDLPALTPSVLLLTGLTGQCRVTNTNPMVLTTDADRTPLAAHFDTECVAAVDTVVGRIGTSSTPVRSAFLEGDGGESFLLAGPAADDLFQLGGIEVRLWGVRAGTSMDVYGYELRSWLGEPRFVGVPLQRDGALWLYGERALELVDAPAELYALAGALVWVGGAEVGTSGLSPTIYGVIKEALP